ncbi:unnamed protein product [Dovyalis caffra]|uniref:Uncharacterized protein n=1 Tax=Dovyalis caffra TaxID=77055 RepID=A0AAV1RSC1_9ROSI|nr:unnamed protein product [Dovyalis caffra]
MQGNGLVVLAKVLVLLSRACSFIQASYRAVEFVANIGLLGLALYTPPNLGKIENRKSIE